MDYGKGHIVAIAKSEESVSKLLSEDKNVLFVDPSKHLFRFLPANEQIDLDAKTASQVEELSEFDAVEWYSESNFRVLFRANSNDNALVVTNKCNSNCIMCPCSEYLRRMPANESVEHLCHIIEYMPSDTKHLTITGGEPTLLRGGLLAVFEKLRVHFEDFTQFQFLTNGRAFSDNSYLQRFLEVVPDTTYYGIPLYAYSPDTHDPITQAAGSFTQTVSGIQALLHHGANVELRIVISKLNHQHMDRLAEYVVENLHGLSHVAIMAVEMCGEAAVNRGAVWLDYQDAFHASKIAIKTLLTGGIDVRLYNFPLCKVERGYWSLCRKSISDYKIRYNEGCRQCNVRDLCGGVFQSTLGLTKMELTPI